MFYADRKQAIDRLNYARSIGDTVGIVIAMAQFDELAKVKKDQREKKCLKQKI